MTIDRWPERATRLLVVVLPALLSGCMGTVTTLEPDGSPSPKGDAALSSADAGLAGLDAAQAGADAAALWDGALSAADSAAHLDAAVPGPDASAFPPDAAAAAPDATAIEPPDAAVCSGASCVRPSTCPAGSPRARFVEQTAPSGLEPLALADVSVTFANCGANTWIAATSAGAATGIKLGSQAPEDNFTWSTNRYAIPADVPAGSQVQIPFTVRAPATASTYSFSWALVDEGVAWLKESSPVLLVDVADHGGPVTLCAGVTADPTGTSRADLALQQCIDATPAGGTLEIPAGTYRIEGPVQIGHPMTLRTQGTSGASEACLGNIRCAALRAAPDLAVANGFLQLGATNDVVLDHLVLDGNRSARLGSSSAALCASGKNNREGFNATSGGCSHCSFLASASINALCGTGFEWMGDDATITNCTFRDNGDNTTKNMWSDGLTLLQSDRAVVEGNLFQDNSDVDLICGGARDGSIRNNTIVQSRQVAFAGLMLDNFNGGTHGDFAGAAVQGNTVSCGASLCHFGIELGPHPWYLSANITGGTVTGNSVSDARQGINVEGAGTVASPLVLYSNPVAGNATSAQFLCGTKSCSALNISPDSVVDRNGDTSPATSWTWHGCP
jgi:hypothetical protein